MLSMTNFDFGLVTALLGLAFFSVTGFYSSDESESEELQSRPRKQAKN